MTKTLLYSALSLALTFTAVGCDVDQVRDGKLPTLDVDASGDPGQLPSYDVDGPDVDVSMEESEVTTPDVDVEMKEKTISTPDVDVTLPSDNE
ncbi:hypothetical protein LF1_40380 [Rubripirellula obstinata]|uniref:Secreted protein n=1 Tax=Rubripirellula obstinata TaxID=406547 RepID=A0A5B1CKB0_9BACT|nr:hypothetical protein [Rubripirellula obstinata]KAA1261488.1 hypothetical protein LF1_40380 [Rubripirellula obstinata]